MISTLVLAVGLAFAIGYAFTIIPMLRTMPLRQAARVTVVGDTASIAAMEITENSLVFTIPGFMHASLTDALFWLGLGIILPAGYAVAYPTMYWAARFAANMINFFGLHLSQCLSDILIMHNLQFYIDRNDNRVQ